MLYVSLTKVVDNAAPAVGTNVTFTIDVTNAAGFSSASAVEVTDLLPTGYTYVSDTGGGAYVSGTGVWTMGAVAAGTPNSLLYAPHPRTVAVISRRAVAPAARAPIVQTPVPETYDQPPVSLT